MLLKNNMRWKDYPKINILEVLRQTDGMALKKMLSFVIVKNMFLLLIYFSITIILKKFLLNVVMKLLVK
ncbi:Uncharacterised protein [Streptococcus pneumoniae]|nr:Uncharacterised protein [Streptococcus pneumoniae]